MPSVQTVVKNYPTLSDPAKPAWHFGPPACWMNDPNGGCWHDGWWHVFYQHNPDGEEWTNMHWGHARSRDLVHWEHLALALLPQLGADEKTCCSGCLAFAADGRPYILYTSSKTDPAAALTQVLATPNDSEWRTWTQHVAEPFLALPTHDGPAFEGSWRDPFVFRTAGRTFLILGAALGDEAVVALYENSSGRPAGLDLPRHHPPRTEDRDSVLRVPVSHSVRREVGAHCIARA